MKGNKVVILIVAIVVIAMAAVVGSMTTFFKNNETQSGHAISIEGTVAKKEDGRILVVSGKEETEIKKGQTEEEMLEGAEEAIWFTLSIDQSKSVKEFDNVRIKYSQVDESFPAQASANSIEVLNDETTE